MPLNIYIYGWGLNFHTKQSSNYIKLVVKEAGVHLKDWCFSIEKLRSTFFIDNKIF